MYALNLLPTSISLNMNVLCCCLIFCSLCDDADLSHSVKLEIVGTLLKLNPFMPTHLCGTFFPHLFMQDIHIVFKFYAHRARNEMMKDQMIFLNFILGSRQE